MIEPYYDDGMCRIYHGDCIEVLAELDEVTAIVSDPPYGINWDTDYTRFRGGSKHENVLGDKGEFNPTHLLGYPKIVLWGANLYCRYLPMGSWLCWDKRHASGKSFLADAELAWMRGGHGTYIFAKTWQGFNKDKGNYHPTQKSVELMSWCLDKAKVTVDDVVCDAYMGSGTTLRACKDRGVKSVGIELVEKYCEEAAQRLSQEVLGI